MQNPYTTNHLISQTNNFAQTSPVQAAYKPTGARSLLAQTKTEPVPTVNTEKSHTVENLTHSTPTPAPKTNEPTVD